MGHIEVMLHVRLLEGVESGPDGSRTKVFRNFFKTETLTVIQKFSKEETQWPYQLYRPLSCLGQDTRYFEVMSPALEKRFPAKTPIICMDVVLLFLYC